MRSVGVRGAPWRALVDDRGTVSPADGSTPLGWHVAGEDRWYSPASEPTVRQKWFGGCPVVETRMRVGPADVVQRVWSVADAGGVTLVEFENETPVAVAVAVTRPDVLTVRTVSNQPPAGITLPEGSFVLPLAHGSSVRVGIPHGRPTGPVMLDNLPDHQQVLRGWESACAVASRLSVPDHAAVSGATAARCALLLGDGEGDGDGASAIELARLGETHHDTVSDVVSVVQRRLRAERRARTLRWDTPHLLLTAAHVCRRLDDDVAAGDIGVSWLRIADRPVAPPPDSAPAGIAVIAWLETLLAAGSPAGGSCTVLPGGIPEPWWGSSCEVHGLPADPVRTLSYAVRWHGERPALLWEVGGAPGLVLVGGQGNENWHSTDASGETLLSSPRH